MITKVVGTSFRDNRFELPIGTELDVHPDCMGAYTGNKHNDENALSLWFTTVNRYDGGTEEESYFLGYIPKKLNQNKFTKVTVSRVFYKNDEGALMGENYEQGLTIAGIEIECEIKTDSIVFHNVDQNSDEWFKLRLGKITSSESAKIMAHGKGLGKSAIDYAIGLKRENQTGEHIDKYSNDNMSRGHTQEPEAIKLYEQQKEVEVKNGGIFVSGILADSPDGVVGEGLLEVKSVIKSVQEKTRKRNAPDPAYKWQIQHHLLVTKKSWVDYVSYCEELNEILVFRVYPDEAMQKEMREKYKLFKYLYDNLKKLV